MKPQIRKLWTGALRSGTYRQSAKRLHTNDGGFCALGVLCELHRLETGRTAWKKQPGFDHLMLESSGGGECDYLPPAVSRWAGLKEENPSLEYDGKKIGITSLNDRKLGFNELADIIDRTF